VNIGVSGSPFEEVSSNGTVEPDSIGLSLDVAAEHSGSLTAADGMCE